MITISFRQIESHLPTRIHVASFLKWVDHLLHDFLSYFQNCLKENYFETKSSLLEIKYVPLRQKLVGSFELGNELGDKIINESFFPITLTISQLIRPSNPIN